MCVFVFKFVFVCVFVLEIYILNLLLSSLVQTPLELTGIKYNSASLPKTSSKFFLKPLSYGHGLILSFSNISIVVQFAAISFKCMMMKPNRLSEKARSTINAMKATARSAGLRSAFLWPRKNSEK